MASGLAQRAHAPRRPAAGRGQPGLAGAVLAIGGRAHQRFHVYGRLWRGVLRSRPRWRGLGLDRPLWLRAAADAGRGTRDAGLGRDGAANLGQAGSALGGVRNRVVIARNPFSTSLRSIASRPARTARAIAITCALNVT